MTTRAVIKKITIIEPLLSVVEICKAMGITRQTLWEIRKSDEFPRAISIGNQLRWRAGEIEKYIENHREPD